MVVPSTEALVVVLNSNGGLPPVGLSVGLFVGLPVGLSEGLSDGLREDEPAEPQLYHELPDEELSSLLSGFPHVKLLEMLELPFGPGFPDHEGAPRGSSEYTSQCCAEPLSSCRRYVL